MTVIAAVRGEVPEFRYTQDEVAEALIAMPGFSDHADFVRAVHRSAKVDSRHTVLPLEAYAGLTDFGTANDVSSSTQWNWAARRSSVRSKTRAWSPPTSTSS
jgi:alkylresorcinol/alkylpyrone synthase